MSKRTPGVEVRHARECPSRKGGVCPDNAQRGCKPTFRAWVYDRRAKSKLRETFPTLAAAKNWRADQLGAVRRGERKAGATVTVREAGAELIAGIGDGSIRNRHGDVYKPSARRGYARSLRDRIEPKIGATKLADVTADDLQALVEEWLGEGLDPSTIRNHLMPLRVIYRRARKHVPVSPLAALELPAVRGRRERVASPVEMDALIAALPERDRALWATAAYAGLRLGELRALRWGDVDLEKNLIHVAHGWDPFEGEIAPKSRKGVRKTPIIGPLRSLLLRHQLLTGRREGFVFGRKATEPFTPTSIEGRASTAWKKAGLARITPHECRHTCVSLFHAAGVPLETIGDYVGHSSAYMTDRYRHLVEGERERHAAQVEAYLSAAAGGPAVGQLGHSSSGF